MTERTERLALPIIAPGQAQKEMAHNEALALIDLAVQASVEAVGLEAPPPDPEPGRCWIVGNAPVGAWAGRAGAIAGWTAGGWRFVAPRPGLAAWSVADGVEVRCDGSGWRQGAAIAAPAGGGTMDTEARATLTAILAALRVHGLIAS